MTDNNNGTQPMGKREQDRELLHKMVDESIDMLTEDHRIAWGVTIMGMPGPAITDNAPDEADTSEPVTLCHLNGPPEALATGGVPGLMLHIIQSAEGNVAPGDFIDGFLNTLMNKRPQDLTIDTADDGTDAPE